MCLRKISIKNRKNQFTFTCNGSAKLRIEFDWQAAIDGENDDDVCVCLCVWVLSLGLRNAVTSYYVFSHRDHVRLSIHPILCNEKKRKKGEGGATAPTQTWPNDLFSRVHSSTYFPSTERINNAEIAEWNWVGAKTRRRLKTKIRNLRTTVDFRQLIYVHEYGNTWRSCIIHTSVRTACSVHLTITVFCSAYNNNVLPTEKKMGRKNMQSTARPHHDPTAKRKKIWKTNNSDDRRRVCAVRQSTDLPIEPYRFHVMLLFSFFSIRSMSGWPPWAPSLCASTKCHLLIFDYFIVLTSFDEYSVKKKTTVFVWTIRMCNEIKKYQMHRGQFHNLVLEKPNDEMKEKTPIRLYAAFVRCYLVWRFE